MGGGEIQWAGVRFNRRGKIQWTGVRFNGSEIQVKFQAWDSDRALLEIQAVIIHTNRNHIY